VGLAQAREARTQVLGCLLERRMKSVRYAWATGAELVLVGLIVCYGSFSIFRLVLLLLLSSQSLWIRGFGWADLGLRRPASAWRTLLCSVAASLALLVTIKIAIVPFAVFVTGEPVDLSVFGEPGDTRALRVWLTQAWTLAAFGEEMVFRGYLIRRVADLVGGALFGQVVAVVASSALFGIAHGYQGWSGVIATGIIGALLGTLYLWSHKNLWTVIICHGIVDTVVLSAVYFGRRSLIFP
jgi:membrane protease YdiL (CAAX protease family)